ncbi:hypothetical protein QYZ87_06610 [Porphyromonadaceae bacterium W3.11]|nr:hypothetical protein [Porphyromonadaceae bacterium W3.11]
MKKLFLAILSIIMVQGAMAQIVPAEDPIGTLYTYEVQAAGVKLDQEIKLIENNGDSFKVEIKQDMPNNLGVLNYTCNYIIQGGMLIQPLAEMQKLLEEQMSKLGASGTSVSLDGEPLHIPLNGNIGDEFPLNKYTTTVSAMGFSQNVDIQTVSNKIIGQETITVPAGTFETIVVEAKGESTVSAMGQTKSGEVLYKFWIIPGRGVAKSSIDEGVGGQTIQVLKSITRPE